MTVVLAHIVARQGVTLDKNRARGGYRNVPAYVADLRNNKRRLFAHFDRFIKHRYLKAVEPCVRERVLFIINTGSIAVCVLVYHTVSAYRNIHTAAADIVNAVSTVAHADKRIHKMHLSVMQKCYHTDRIYR